MYSMRPYWPPWSPQSPPRRGDANSFNSLCSFRLFFFRHPLPHPLPLHEPLPKSIIYIFVYVYIQLYMCIYMYISYKTPPPSPNQLSWHGILSRFDLGNFLRILQILNWSQYLDSSDIVPCHSDILLSPCQKPLLLSIYIVIYLTIYRSNSI